MHGVYVWKLLGHNNGRLFWIHFNENKWLLLQFMSSLAWMSFLPMQILYFNGRNTLKCIHERAAEAILAWWWWILGQLSKAFPFLFIAQLTTFLDKMVLIRNIKQKKKKELWTSITEAEATLRVPTYTLWLKYFYRMFKM